MRSRLRSSFGGALGAIAGIGLIVRVVYVLVFERALVLSIDATYFHLAGINLARGRGFIDPLAFAITHGVQRSEAATHPPGYIAALAIPSFVGLRTPFEHQLWSCLIGTATIVFIGLTGRMLAGPRAGLVAAAIAAVYPNLWLNDGLLMSETLAICAVALVMLALYAYLRSPSRRGAVWVGVSIAGFALTRAEGVLILPVLAIWWLFVPRAMPWRERAERVGVVVGVAVLALVPWIAYNNTRFERFTLISTNLGPTMAEANCHAVYQGESIGFYTIGCLPNVALEGDESQADPVLRHRALSYIRENLPDVPWVVTTRLGRTFGLFHPRRQLQLDNVETARPVPAATAGLLMYYALVPLAIGGAIVLRRRRVPIFPLLSVVIVVAVAVAVTFGQTRYRAPAEVPLVLLAACGLDALIAGIRARGSTRPPPPA